MLDILDMCEYYAVFIEGQLAGIFTDFYECIVWCSGARNQILLKRVRRDGNAFRISDVPIGKIELVE